MYRSILVTTKLILNEDKTALKLQLPFRIYAQNIICEGKNITYRLHNLKNEGKEVLAKVDYMKEDYNEVLKSQTKEAEAFVGNMGSKWEDIKKDARYLKHYSVTKKDSLATYTELGVKVPYDKADKDEVVKFCDWKEPIVEETIEVKEIEAIILKKE